jgi:hypothetical protein
MNFKKSKLKEIKQWYECLSFFFVKNKKPVPKEYNIILDLIEDLETKK